MRPPGSFFQGDEVGSWRTITSVQEGQYSSPSVELHGALVFVPLDGSAGSLLCEHPASSSSFVHLHELGRLCCWLGMKCHFTYKAWVKCRLWQGRETAGLLFQVPKLPLPTSPTCCPAFENHLQEVFLLLPLFPVVVHYRSSSMAAEVRNG